MPGRTWHRPAPISSATPPAFADCTLPIAPWAWACGCRPPPPGNCSRETASPSGATGWDGWGSCRSRSTASPTATSTSSVVKHQVYHPTWYHPDRLAYTLNLIDIQHGLLPASVSGSISTLPIAWGNPSLREGDLTLASSALRQIAARLGRLEAETGRFICLCLEPEPGCVLQRSGDLVGFFERFLLGGPDESIVRRHLRVCHDVCHQAIMFEDQAEVLRAYRDAGIGVGKVQVSSAVCMPLERLPAGEHAAALEQLSSFVEERDLHQTVIREGASAPIFLEDLPLALARGDSPAGEWRVHFHVPIYLERFGRLETTQFAIRECLQAIGATGDCRHFEVETYAWGVLPAELQQPDLAAGIAAEMRRLQREMEQLPGGK